MSSARDGNDQYYPKDEYYAMHDYHSQYLTNLVADPLSPNHGKQMGGVSQYLTIGGAVVEGRDG
jgi:hypothetical protein